MSLVFQQQQQGRVPKENQRKCPKGVSPMGIDPECQPAAANLLDAVAEQ